MGNYDETDCLDKADAEECARRALEVRVLELELALKQAELAETRRDLEAHRATIAAKYDLRAEDRVAMPQGTIARHPRLPAEPAEPSATLVSVPLPPDATTEVPA